jgi:hypothetical protein
LDHFQIPETQPVIILRNGAHGSLEDALASGDELLVLPPLDGG